jgi:glutamate-5-semialdehyde dehydrogenase
MQALRAIADALDTEGDALEQANQEDLAVAREESVAPPLLKRLHFGPEKRALAIDGVRAVAAQGDPLGAVLEQRVLDDGLNLQRISTPIGVICMIFESRPDALVQIAALAIKSGNGMILKGGSEARRSNRALGELIHRVSCAAGLPEGWLQLLETREDIGELLALHDLVDLVIPRGSNEFVQYIMHHTTIPVIGHADGICHLYIDQHADAQMAMVVAVDAKTQYVAVCNATETILVHEAAAPRVLPEMVAQLTDRGVEVRGCLGTQKIVPSVSPATEADWTTEYLDYIVAIRIVPDLAGAIDHINRYGSGHTDAIITDNRDAAESFIRSVDSASVMWNASTRFADGFRYGLGAEVGISTSRIHARGPVGVSGLMSYKWVLRGNGHVVQDYASGAKRFTHQDHLR